MKKVGIARSACLALFVGLAGCATGPGGGSIYVPVGGEDRGQAPEPPRADIPDDQQERVWRKSEQPVVSKPKPDDTRSPSYSESGDQLPAAAQALVRDAEQRLRQGDPAGAIARLERAQRIAPRSSEVYFKLAEAYVAGDNLGAAEQFTLKGLSVAGSDERMQRSGWLLLADIRRARGNVAGADQAEARASAL
ncbi:tetratricopeptide repeat protein [Marinobacter daepoensis]|uniref:Tetratricopeptide repeat protein n=1 Tax=Marinobacter daepoensis TaxID=262077 RepID=A0ABS3BAB4_9GAMM|nr:tetratricopeptide repeat protein [Marinobacter daepoensis]MBN7768463.1 tetratricopeptide repeat protein [Marinobacter daepoensis]MBY6079200.1 tetratricopeptide repeat protein [Marinobacter daepoensis]